LGLRSALGLAGESAPVRVATSSGAGLETGSGLLTERGSARSWVRGTVGWRAGRSATGLGGGLGPERAAPSGRALGLTKAREWAHSLGIGKVFLLERARGLT